MTTRPNSEMLRTEVEACVLEPRRDPEMEAFARREMGMVPLDLPYLIPCPWVARAAVIFNEATGCFFIWTRNWPIRSRWWSATRTRADTATRRSGTLLRVQGMSEERVQELESGQSVKRAIALLGDRDRAHACRCRRV